MKKKTCIILAAVTVPAIIAVSLMLCSGIRTKSAAERTNFAEACIRALLNVEEY